MAGAHSLRALDQSESAPPAARSSGPGAASCVVAITSARDGAGKTTLGAHLAVAALQLGVEVGVVDLDFADRGLTRWLRRRAAAVEAGTDLVMPASVKGEARAPEDERARWPALAEAMRRSCGLVVVDLPAGNGSMQREALARADRVLTLAPDCDVEVDRLLEADLSGRDVGRPTAYARMIWQERLSRARSGGPFLDWRLLRTRVLPEQRGRESARFADALRRLGAEEAPAMVEHPSWRWSFADGVTALDLPGAHAGRRPAAEMLRDLLITLQAPSLEGARLAL